jgi:hypothetical protein
MSNRREAFVSRVSPLLLHEGVANSWVNAVQVALTKTGNPENVSTHNAVAPAGREPVKIYISINGDIERAEFLLREYIPDCSFHTKIELVYDFRRHVEVAEKRHFILIKQKSTLPAHLIQFKLDGLSTKETLWRAFSILAFILFSFLLYNHWAAYSQPWMGLIDTPRRLLSHLWQR